MILQLREEAQQELAALDDPPARPLDMLSLEARVAHELQRWLQTQPHPLPAQGRKGVIPPMF